MFDFKLYMLVGRLATPVVRLFASRAPKPRTAIIESQVKTLRQLVRTARGTQFGRDHGFAKIRDVQDYQASVPVRDYEDFQQQYWASDFPVLDDVTWCRVALKSEMRRFRRRVLPLIARFGCHGAFAPRAPLRDVIDCG